MTNNYKSAKTIMSPKAIKRLTNVKFGELHNNGRNAHDIILTFDREKVLADLKMLKSINTIEAQRREGCFIALGTFAFSKPHNNTYSIILSEITEKKLWRILHNFGDALIAIEKFDKEWIESAPYCNTYRETSKKIWGNCPKYSCITYKSAW